MAEDNKFNKLVRQLLARSRVTDWIAQARFRFTAGRIDDRAKGRYRKDRALRKFRKDWARGRFRRDQALEKFRKNRASRRGTRNYRELARRSRREAPRANLPGDGGTDNKP